MMFPWKEIKTSNDTNNTKNSNNNCPYTEFSYHNQNIKLATTSRRQAQLLIKGTDSLVKNYQQTCNKTEIGKELKNRKAIDLFRGQMHTNLPPKHPIIAI